MSVSFTHRELLGGVCPVCPAGGGTALGSGESSRGLLCRRACFSTFPGHPAGGLVFRGHASPSPTASPQWQEDRSLCLLVLFPSGPTFLVHGGQKLGLNSPDHHGVVAHAFLVCFSARCRLSMCCRCLATCKSAAQWAGPACNPAAGKCWPHRSLSPIDQCLGVVNMAAHVNSVLSRLL